VFIIKTISYQKLTKGNFSINSLDKFERYQEVKKCWKKVGKQMQLFDNVYIENWNLKKLRNVAKDLLDLIESGGIAYGAFDGEKIIGFSSVSLNAFGSQKQYVELKMIQVSFQYRSKGIGRKLFEYLVDSVKLTEANKLYISAHSSYESQEFYKAVGCTMAVEVNQAIAENEPFDIQLEYLVK